MQNVIVQIKYCIEWNYLPNASSLAAAIKDSLGLNAELIEGRGGIFEVTVNNDKIYDNQEVCGRLPSNEEVLEKLKTFSV